MMRTRTGRVLAACVVLAAVGGGAALAARGGSPSPTRVQLSPYIAPAVQRQGDCVNKLGPTMDPLGWVKGGDVLRCKGRHETLRARVTLWYWNGATWVAAGVGERTAHNTVELEVATSQRICGWDWAPYWKETADYTVAGLGSFQHATGAPGYHPTPYMHRC